MLTSLIKWFFLILGVIFFCLILAGVYLYVADPYEVRPLIDSLLSNEPAQQETDPEAEEGFAPQGDAVMSDEQSAQHPLLTPSQEKALESVGINTAALPSEITPEMEVCFEETLGAERTQQIAAGDTPTAAEIFKARSCIE